MAALGTTAIALGVYNAQEVKKKKKKKKTR
jgi:hypothetical protein